MSWKTVALGEVCSIVNGGTPKSDVKDYWDGSLNWITPKEMGKLSSREISSTERKITELGLKNSSAKLLPINSVILSSRAPIGHLAINKEPMATNQGCKGLVPTERINYEFLYYFLSHSKQLLNNMGSGATFKELSGSKLATVKIPLPSLVTQQKIVDKLDTIFAEIDRATMATEANAKNVESLLKSLIEDTFRQQFGKWESVKLSEVTELSRGHNPPKSKFVYEPKEGYVRFYQIRDGSSDDKAVYVPDSPQLHKVNKDDILMVAYRHVGRAFRGVVGAFNVALCKIKNKNREVLSDDYLFYLIPSSFVRGELLKQSERSLIPSMSINHLKEISIPLPPIEVQISTVEKLKLIEENALSMKKSYELKALNLDSIKQSILKQAFNGELVKE